MAKLLNIWNRFFFGKFVVFKIGSFWNLEHLKRWSEFQKIMLYFATLDKLLYSCSKMFCPSQKFWRQQILKSGSNKLSEKD